MSPNQTDLSTLYYNLLFASFHQKVYLGPIVYLFCLIFTFFKSFFRPTTPFLTPVHAKMFYVIALSVLPSVLQCVPPLSKEGTQILKNSKRGRNLKKNLWVGKTRSQGKIFPRKRRNPTFQIGFRDRKGHKQGLLEKNKHKYFQKFACSSKQCLCFEHSWCIIYLNGTKCVYSRICIKD